MPPTIPNSPPVPGVTDAARGSFGCRRPDAVRVPKHFFPLGPREDEARRLQNELYATLRERRSYMRPRIDVPEPGETYVVPWSAGPGQTLKFPTGHPFEGQDRYDWFLAKRNAAGVFVPVAPETGHPGEEHRVKVGFVKEDPYAHDPAVRAKMDEALDAKIEELRQDPAFLARLRAMGYLVDEEAEGDANVAAQ